MGFYHQHERDRAAALGCFGLIAMLLLAILLIVTVLARIWQP